ncbi:Smr/MutS family protein [Azonexus sp. R2A61]|uniref:Smr/MutS family protein n=1 Tax=Azonexus sp. R2A61 TaxID=2744443 RepID=UPI001F2E8A73|nr:Smr/MutS family protein [Azonexus sp. R2A61]
MATKPGKSSLKDGLRAVWRSGQVATPAIRPAAPAAIAATPALPEDDGKAAFRRAVADARPLPAVNRVELSKKPSRRIAPPRPQDPPAQSRTRHDDDDLPAFWHNDQAPRRLPDDPEQAAFLRAMSGVEPLPERNLASLDKPPPAPRPKQSQADRAAVLHESLHAPIALQDRLEGGDEPAYLRHGLANTVLRDLRRGRWVQQGEIDLHGLDREQARQSVAGFLQHSLQQGWRCVRIVHGKGHGSPQKLSILRQLVRGWLAQREEVLAYCQAKPQDGGEGALLVLLRSPKKPGAA